MRTQFIRIYSENSNPDHHTFYVGHMAMSDGVSQRISSFDINERTSFKDLRQMILWEEHNGSYRRTVPLYSELLEAMKSSTNRYGYSKEDQRDFRFGIIRNDRGVISDEAAATAEADSGEEMKKEGGMFPILIQKEVEDEPIDQIIEPGLDLVLVPLVLIPK